MGTATWRDYLALTKPRAVFLNLITASAAMVLAAGGLPPGTILVAVLAGGGLVAAASNALNCYFDRDIDKMMSRTRRRPFPAGMLTPGQGLIFALLTGCLGLFLLSYFVSWITATLALGALVYYIFVYTLWLKRKTYWGSIVGSGAGAFPVVIGWLAVNGTLQATPFLLFALVVLWTPPHFWSLAIWHQEDYLAAGLTVIPSGSAPRWIIAFSSLLVLVSLSVAPVSKLGPLYLSLTSLLGLGLIILAICLHLTKNTQTARHLFLYSVFYLMALFSLMLADKVM